MRRQINNQFIIQDFRSWRGPNYIDLNRVNLIFGANSSGKSSILHALALLKQSFRNSVGFGVSAANLVPKGNEIDLGRIEDQISQKRERKSNESDAKLAFGMRFNSPENLTELLELNSRRRREEGSRKTERPESLSENTYRPGASLEDMHPIDFKISYDSIGRVEAISLEAEGSAIIQVKVTQKPESNQFEISLGSNSNYWSNAILWEEMQKDLLSDAPDKTKNRQEQTELLKRQLVELENELRILQIEAKESGSEKKSKISSKEREILMQKLEKNQRHILHIRHDKLLEMESLEEELFIPSFLGETVNETKKNFFQAVQKPFSVTRDDDEEAYVQLRFLQVSRLRTRRNSYMHARTGTLDTSPAEDPFMAIRAIELAYRYLNPSAFDALALLQTCLEAFDSFVSQVEQIGPHRERPDRITFVNPSERKSTVGSKGENVVPIIYKASEANLRTMNNWFEKLQIGYSISKRFAPKYNIAELKLTDREGNEISLADVGYGIGQILPIVIACTMRKNAIIAIEQPELHLHPKLQANLMDLFIWSASERENIFLLETHSEHMVLRLQRRQRDGQSIVENEYLKDEGTSRRPRRAARFRPLVNVISEWRSIPLSVSMQIVNLTDDPIRSLITSVSLNSKGEFRDSWPGDFFPERHIERGLL